MYIRISLKAIICLILISSILMGCNPATKLTDESTSATIAKTVNGNVSKTTGRNTDQLSSDTPVKTNSHITPIVTDNNTSVEPAYTEQPSPEPTVQTQGPTPTEPANTVTAHPTTPQRTPVKLPEPNENGLFIYFAKTLINYKPVDLTISDEQYPGTIYVFINSVTPSQIKRMDIYVYKVDGDVETNINKIYAGFGMVWTSNYFSMVLDTPGKYRLKFLKDGTEQVASADLKILEYVH